MRAQKSDMQKAYSQVMRNRGAPGVDGLRCEDLKAWLQSHWQSARAALLAGTYLPRAVRRVDIPKPQGGVRTLGVPTVVDRLIQQALHQVMQPLFEPTFSDGSYGFRPGRSARQAVVQAAKPHSRRQALGGGHGSGEILRPCEPRCAHAPGGQADRRQARPEIDPPLPASGPDGRRGRDSEDTGHAARRAVVAAAVEHPADRSGPRTGAARTGLLPVRGRLRTSMCRASGRGNASWPG
jgi:hypothetical protein